MRQGFDSDPVADCPECGAKSHRKIHAPPVIFKGSGWYVTDYGKGRGNNGLSADRSGSKSDDGEKSESDKASGASKSSAGAKAKSASAAGGDE